MGFTFKTVVLILGDLISLVLFAIILSFKYLYTRVAKSDYLAPSILMGILIVGCIILKLIDQSKKRISNRKYLVFLILTIFSTVTSFFLFIFFGPHPAFLVFGLIPLFYTGRLLKFYLAGENRQQNITSELFWVFFVISVMLTTFYLESSFSKIRIPLLISYIFTLSILLWSFLISNKPITIIDSIPLIYSSTILLILLLLGYFFPFNLSSSTLPQMSTITIHLFIIYPSILLIPLAYFKNTVPSSIKNGIFLILWSFLLIFFSNSKEISGKLRTLYPVEFCVFGFYLVIVEAVIKINKIEKVEALHLGLVTFFVFPIVTVTLAACVGAIEMGAIYITLFIEISVGFLIDLFRGSKKTKRKSTKMDRTITINADVLENENDQSKRIEGSRIVNKRSNTFTTIFDNNFQSQDDSPTSKKSSKSTSQPQSTFYLNSLKQNKPIRKSFETLWKLIYIIEFSILLSYYSNEKSNEDLRNGIILHFLFMIFTLFTENIRFFIKEKNHIYFPLILFGLYEVKPGKIKNSELKLNMISVIFTFCSTLIEVLLFIILQYTASYDFKLVLIGVAIKFVVTFSGISLKFYTWHNGKYSLSIFNVIIWFTVYNSLGFLMAVKNTKNLDLSDLEKYSIIVFVISILLFVLFSFLAIGVYLRFSAQELSRMKNEMFEDNGFKEAFLKIYGLQVNLKNSKLSCRNCQNHEQLPKFSDKMRNTLRFLVFKKEKSKMSRSISVKVSSDIVSISPENNVTQRPSKSNNQMNISKDQLNLKMKNKKAITENILSNHNFQDFNLAVNQFVDVDRNYLNRRWRTIFISDRINKAEKPISNQDIDKLFENIERYSDSSSNRNLINSVQVLVQKSMMKTASHSYVKLLQYCVLPFVEKEESEKEFKRINFVLFVVSVVLLGPINVYGLASIALGSLDVWMSSIVNLNKIPNFLQQSLDLNLYFSVTTYAMLLSLFIFQIPIVKSKLFSCCKSENLRIWIIALFKCYSKFFVFEMISAFYISFSCEESNGEYFMRSTQFECLGTKHIIYFACTGFAISTSIPLITISYPIVQRSLIGQQELFDLEFYYKIMYCIVATVLSDSLIQFKLGMACICLAVGFITLLKNEKEKIDKIELTFTLMINLFALIILNYRSLELQMTFFCFIVGGTTIFLGFVIVGEWKASFRDEPEE